MSLIDQNCAMKELKSEQLYKQVFCRSQDNPTLTTANRFLRLYATRIDLEEKLGIVVTYVRDKSLWFNVV